MRHDLLALTPDGLALLSNKGLVKRAQKEIASGQGPRVLEEADGTVQGRFPDGVESALPPGKGLHEARCTCGAPGVCRHRVATALVYIEQAREEEAAGARQVGSTALPGAGAAGTMGSAPEVSQYLGRRAYDRALRLRGKLRARVESESLVHLETCSVRFLSGRRLDFARCDCSAAGPCEHLALALWALEGSQHEAASQPLSLEPLSPALGLVEELISVGASRLGRGLGSRFAEARRILRKASMVWPDSLLEEIEQELGYYHARGGRYRPSQLARQILSLWARARASRQRPELAAELLGLNQAPETALRKVRLGGLGCRVEKEQTLFYLADVAGDRVLVLPFPTGARGPAGLSRDGLAAGQLVSAAAHRSANGILRLGRGPQSLTGCGDWSHLQALEGPPPRENRLLGDCHAAPDVRVMKVTEVLGGFYSPGQQELTLHTLCQDQTGLRLTLSYRSCAPFALECLWTARESLQAVAGPMRREPPGWVMEPTALLADGQVRVPDLASGGHMDDVPLGLAQPLEDPLSGALQAATACWIETVHRGLGRGQDAIAQAARSLRRVGMESTARALETAREPEDWLRLAVRLETARELV